MRRMPTVASRVGPSQSAVNRPGWSSRAFTLRPESSASAGSPLARVAASALMVAFSSKVTPVSSGDGRPSSSAETISTPNAPSMVRISPALPRLWVATTSLGKAKRRGIRICRPSPANRQSLQVREFAHALFGEIEQFHELRFGKWLLLRRALDLDDSAVARQHEVGVGLGLGILWIVEVEHRRSLEQAARHRGHLAGDRVGRELAVPDQALEGEMQRYPGTGDAGGTGAAVRLQHVAVDIYLPLTHGGQIDHGAQRAADQTLDLLGATRLLAASSLTVRAGMGRARQHAIFGGDTAAPRITQERRHFP